MSSRIEGLVARLHGLHPRVIDLSLERLQALLDKLGNPERRLPPVIHVAGTNGKGSTCAFLRAIGESAGMRVHVYTSPHLVRFNERIRLAGELVDDERLAGALEHLEAVNAGAPITVFEMITAVAFHLFAETPADLCVIEVGLGGRFDATNVIAPPVATAITSISLDHREFLGDTLTAIAGEKAGIMKPAVPVAIGRQPQEVMAVLAAEAAAVGARMCCRDEAWTIAPHEPAPSDRSVLAAPPISAPSASVLSAPALASALAPAAALASALAGAGLRYQDAAGVLDLPPPALIGPHQYDNAGIAIAALRASGLAVPERAYAEGLARAEWPARMQRLTGRLCRLLPRGFELWLDGGHNPGAGVVLAEQLRMWSDRPVHLVVGMKQAKDTASFLAPLLPLARSVWAVAEPEQHLALPVEAIVAASGGVARPGPRIADALAAIPAGEAQGRVLICGSLYLAGEVLKLDGEMREGDGEGP
ncbi:MAG: bifunctional folylpolyglutamate synthase/dihydrofolate synthase [Rhodospirillales bacterium 69-11]|nr:bifunctional folylpolyglutamate synthase/dihydrofolate synthase [Rhodospirillales bacterium]OJW28889.1 MAG: bifunctional folylpolyglutamate synthase/dihydrofolate synthase [Rhodospirillales bacterium 69-11]